MINSIRKKHNEMLNTQNTELGGKFFVGIKNKKRMKNKLGDIIYHLIYLF